MLYVFTDSPLQLVLLAALLALLTLQSVNPASTGSFGPRVYFLVNVYLTINIVYSLILCQFHGATFPAKQNRARLGGHPQTIFFSYMLFGVSMGSLIWEDPTPAWRRPCVLLFFSLQLIRFLQIIWGDEAPRELAGLMARLAVMPFNAGCLLGRLPLPSVRGLWDRMKKAETEARAARAHAFELEAARRAHLVAKATKRGYSLSARKGVELAHIPENATTAPTGSERY